MIKSKQQLFDAKKPVDLSFLLEKSPVLEEEFKSFLDEDEEDDEDIKETLEQIKKAKDEIKHKKGAIPDDFGFWDGRKCSTTHCSRICGSILGSIL